MSILLKNEELTDLQTIFTKIENVQIKLPKNSTDKDKKAKNTVQYLKDNGIDCGLPLTTLVNALSQLGMVEKQLKTIETRMASLQKPSFDNQGTDYRVDGCQTNLRLTYKLNTFVPMRYVNFQSKLIAALDNEAIEKIFNAYIVNALHDLDVEIDAWLEERNKENANATANANDKPKGK